MKKTLYCRIGDEIAFDKETQFDFMRENNLKEMKVHEMEREHGTGYFWCAEIGEIGESNDSCGKNCDNYKPNNVKNGKCKYHRLPLSEKKEVILRLK